MNTPSDGQRERIRNLFEDAVHVSGPSPTLSAGSPLPADFLLGKCRIEKELGRGGMGAVYLARHTTLDIPVAVKVLPPQVAQQSPEFAERFLREARLAAQLKHPNVVSIMDADLDGATGLHYIVQEYVDGGSIREKMKKGPIEEKNGLRVVAAVGKALDAAAQHGIVHRDIKPDNILLSREGTVKLADLGLAKRIGDESSGLTLTDSPMGTPFYMSPEQIQDVKRVDGRSDLYSLGATLYHMITGVPPFQGESVYSVIHKVMNDPVPDPRKVNPEITEFAANLCMRMMAKEPEKRPQTPKDLLEDLRAGSVAPPTARKEVPPARPKPTRRAVPPRRSTSPLVLVLILLAGCMGIGGILGIMAMFFMAVPTADPPTAADYKRHLTYEYPTSEIKRKEQQALNAKKPASDSTVKLGALARGCVLALSFDGEVKDLSPSGHPVRLDGARPAAIGRIFQGLQFDGEDDYVDLPPLDERTVAMWIRPETADQAGWYDGGITGEAHRAFQIGLFAPGLANPADPPYPDRSGIFLGFWTIDALAPYSSAATGWHHVVVTWDGDRTARIAVDGEWREGTVVHHTANHAAGDRVFNLIDVPEPPAEARTMLGRIRAPFWGQGRTHFRGIMDEVAVWDRPLSREEMRALFSYAEQGKSYCELIGRIKR